MTITDFIAEWGEPNGHNFVIAANTFDGNVYLDIAQPRREKIVSVTIENAALTDPEIQTWIYKSFVVYLEKVGLFSDAQIAKLQKERRQKWLIEAFKELANTSPDIAFEAIEGDDFKF